MANTHLAELRDPSGIQCRGYIKHYPKDQRYALFNECFGYIVMSSLGVPQPPAALIQPPERPKNTMPLAFVSCQPRPTFEGTPKEIYNYQDALELQILKKRLFSCPYLPLLIAADQLLINNDRNIGNLVFTGETSFVAIDHGEILGGSTRQANQLLLPTVWAHSVLIERLHCIDELPLDIKSSLIEKVKIVRELFYEVQIDLRVALNCEANYESAVAMDALWWRCAEIEQWFRTRLELLI